MSKSHAIQHHSQRTSDHDQPLGAMEPAAGNDPCIHAQLQPNPASDLAINCREGDEVLVFSTTGQIQSLAEALGTIPYEVLTSVSARVRRIYTQE